MKFKIKIHRLNLTKKNDSSNFLKLCLKLKLTSIHNSFLRHRLLNGNKSQKTAALEGLNYRTADIGSIHRSTLKVLSRSLGLVPFLRLFYLFISMSMFFLL